jgi:hypothetical protein
MRWAGEEAAEDFLAAYESLTGRTYARWWDLEYLLEEDADHWTPEKVALAETVLEGFLA